MMLNNKNKLSIAIVFLLLYLPLCTVMSCRHAGYTVAVKNLEEKSDKPLYTISAAMPQVTQLTDTVTQQAINETIAYYIQSQVTQFKEDITQSQRGNNTLSARSGKLAGELKIETTTGLSGKNMVSVRVSTLYHNTEAAYPEYLERCFTFDTRNGEMLTLERLFIPGSEYLQTISSYIQPQITAQQQADGHEPEPELIKKATAPIAANFNAFLLYPDRMRFFFPYYKISSKHQPDVWIDIPQSIVKPYLLKQYRW